MFGAPRFNSDKGAVYVFRRDATGLWAQAQMVSPPTGDDATNFGHAVSMSGTTFVASAPGATYVGSTSIVGAGAVLVYTKTGPASWTLSQELFANDPQSNGKFGTSSVSLDGNTLAVGANEESSNVGRVHVFTRPNLASAFTFQLILSPTFGGQEHFGISVAVQGDVMAVGADISNQTGAVYTYLRASGVWGSPLRLAPDDIITNSNFGSVVALDGDTLAIGAPGPSSTPGAVYVYLKTSGVWALEQKLTFAAPGGVANDQLGRVVALEGKRIVTGAWKVNGQVGRGYEFIRNGTQPPWAAPGELNPAYLGLPDDAVQGWFGYSGIALQTSTLMVCSPYADANAIPLVNKAGAVYVIAVDV